MMKNYNRKIKGKITVIGLVILGIIAFIYYDLGQYLSLEYIKASQESLQLIYRSHPFSVIAVYMGIYVAVTALSLPGAAVLTLAGDGLFGLFAGTVAVSFASTIGATLAFVVSRFLLREWVQRKFGEKLTAINNGIEKEGAFYLFSLRLVPVFPFFIINLLMGLTRMRVSTFFWVSQIGMLPGTIIYVNAGKQLAQIDSISGILSPAVLISFVILGLFPITMKKVISLYKKDSAPLEKARAWPTRQPGCNGKVNPMGNAYRSDTLAGQSARAGHVNYAASKGGVLQLMKSIAQELGPVKIRVNNIARAAVWLASDDSEYVHGTSLLVDGGMALYPGFSSGG